MWQVLSETKLLQGVTQLIWDTHNALGLTGHLNFFLRKTWKWADFAGDIFCSRGDSLTLKNLQFKKAQMKIWASFMSLPYRSLSQSSVFVLRNVAGYSDSDI